jgi:hypothetical protein
MSTRLLMGRMPSAVSRLASHRGEGPTLTLRSTPTVNRPQPSGSAISTVTDDDGSAAAAAGGSTDGSENGTWK